MSVATGVPKRAAVGLSNRGRPAGLGYRGKARSR